MNRRSGQAEILALAFERDGEQFLFYRNRWSPGIVVTVEEREAFIRAGIWARQKWVSEVRRRKPAAPPRDATEAIVRLRAAMPRRFIFISLFLGILCVTIALGSAIPIWQSAIWLIVGLFFSYGGFANIVARWSVRRLP